MKAPIALFVLSVLLGCSPAPVPEQAVKACLEAGKTPSYHADFAQATFGCK